MRESDSERFVHAARRGVDWIAGSQRDDGSFCDPQDGVGAYYKTPYALALAGRRREAQRLMEWVAQHHLSSSGDFRAPERKAHGTSHEAWPVYADGWLVQGAHLLGRWDLSQQGVAYILSLQAASGGFPELDGDTRFVEPVCTSWGGMAALATGHVAPACRAGDLLAAMVSNQPDPNRFYSRMDVDGHLTTDVPAGAELSYYVDAGRTKQIYYNPGIALILLSHLYRATGEERYLDAGKGIFAFTERCADDVYAFPPSGKLGVGCGLLYSLTGMAAAQRAAVRVGEYLVETQTDEGYWHLPDEELYAAVEDKEGFEVRLDICSEFTIWLMEIAALI